MCSALHPPQTSVSISPAWFTEATLLYVSSENKPSCTNSLFLPWEFAFIIPSARTLFLHFLATQLLYKILGSHVFREASPGTPPVSVVSSEQLLLHLVIN